jgi:hypothetical protein
MGGRGRSIYIHGEGAGVSLLDVKTPWIGRRELAPAEISLFADKERGTNHQLWNIPFTAVCLMRMIANSEENQCAGVLQFPAFFYVAGGRACQK